MGGECRDTNVRVLSACVAGIRGYAIGLWGREISAMQHRTVVAESCRGG